MKKCCDNEKSAGSGSYDVHATRQSKAVTISWDGWMENAEVLKSHRYPESGVAG